MRDRIRILFLSANPADTGHLRLGEEVREVDQRIKVGKYRDTFELIQYHAVRSSDLQAVLLRHQPHIVHFSGRGSFAQEILLEDPSGNSKPLSAPAIAKLFSILKDEVRVVFLSECFSMPQVEGFSAVIDYTVGTSKAVGDKEAITFAAAFYGALAFGRTVTQAFELAKVELDLAGVSSANLPVLFIRDGVDRKEPLLALSEYIDHAVARRLRESFRHLFAGDANEDEKHLIRRELVDGRAVIEQIEGAPDLESDVQAALSQITPTGPIHLEVSEALYRRMQELLFPPGPGLPPPLPGLLFVGRQDSLNDIKKLLGIGHPAQRTGNVTVVRGWPGVGKTTLLGVLGHDPEIAEAFPDGVLWIALEQTPELISKIASWGRALGADDLLRSPGLEEATERLGRLLRDKQMLLMVDDIWNVAHALPFVRAAADSRCALLLSTRLTSVADALAKSDSSRSPDGSIYVLPGLTEEDAITLLRYLAPTVVEEHFEECSQLVRDLECLPLALQVAGRLLNAGTKIGDLINALREGDELLLGPERAPIDRAEGAILPTLDVLFRRSIDQLDELTRECFAYLGMFAPKPATFDVEAMKAVWMVDDPKPIIRKLLDNGLLEPVGAGRFQMHALLVQHASSLLLS